MPYTLDFRVENAALVQISVPIEISGEPAIALTTRYDLEALPVDQAGKTLSLPLPASAADEFAEGDEVTITIAKKAAPPAEQEG